MPKISPKVQEIWSRAKNYLNINKTLRKPVTDNLLKEPWMKQLKNFKIIFKDLKPLGDTRAINLNHIKHALNSYGSAILEEPKEKFESDYSSLNTRLYKESLKFENQTYSSNIQNQSNHKRLFSSIKLKALKSYRKVKFQENKQFFTKKPLNFKQYFLFWY